MGNGLQNLNCPFGERGGYGTCILCAVDRDIPGWFGKIDLGPLHFSHVDWPRCSQDHELKGACRDARHASEVSHERWQVIDRQRGMVVGPSDAFRRRQRLV